MKYSIKTNNQSDRFIHNFMLAAPLAVITFICFGFVLMQPSFVKDDKVSADTSNKSPQEAAKTLKETSGTTLPKLDALPVANSQNPTPSSASSTNTQPPTSTAPANNSASLPSHSGQTDKQAATNHPADSDKKDSGGLLNRLLSAF